jgi:hypothetical protein
LCNHNHNLQDKVIILILQFLLPKATQSLSEKKKSHFLQGTSDSFKNQSGLNRNPNRSTEINVLWMCNEDGWAEKHRQNAQQQCKSEKCKLIYVKRNDG